MITWNDFAKNGLEMLLLLLSNKRLLPDRYHLLLGKGDSKKREMARTCLSLQCESLLGKDTGIQLMNTLMKTMEKLSKCALIDDLVYVVPGVEYSGDVAENLRAILTLGEAPAAVPKKKAKKKKSKRRESSNSIQRSTSGLVSEISSLASGVSDQNNSYVVYTTTEPANRRIVYVRTPDEATVVALGQDKTIPTMVQNSHHQLVVLVEAEKIRPIYLHTGSKEGT